MRPGGYTHTHVIIVLTAWDPHFADFHANLSPGSDCSCHLLFAHTPLQDSTVRNHFTGAAYSILLH